MDKTNEKTLIERLAVFPEYLDHSDYKKCGQCLKEVIKSEVAKELVVSGKISDEYMLELFNETDRRFKDSYLYKEIQRLKTEEGKTIHEAIALMEKKGYYP